MEIETVTTRFRLDAVLNERAARGDAMSQRELARESGVSATTVNAMYRNATAQVSLATLDAIAAVLGIEPGELIEREKPAKRKGR